MKVQRLLDGLEFHEPVPFAQPLLVDQNVRILRWMLQPGQSVREHNAPGSPFYVIVLQGRGLFAGSDGLEQAAGPGELLIFEPGENHTVRALDQELVFVGFLLGVEQMRPDHAGGTLGRA
jgi:quercetin dioxygenase-like cupin family protein